MTHASLFSGIGGFDLAASWMGWENVFQVEIDKFCTKVLEKNFPNVERYGDIKQFDGTKYAGGIDVLTGGFPCQPFSIAGKRKGKEDDRFLWPEMLRVIGEVKPRWIVGENVTGIIGMALDQVLSSLEDKGYNTETYIIPACALNAPHRRDRVWIVAHSVNGGYNSRRNKEAEKNGISSISREAMDAREFNGANISRAFTNHNNRNGKESRLQARRKINVHGIEGERAFTNPISTRSQEQHTPDLAARSGHGSGISFTNWSDFPTVSPIRGGNDGLSSGMVRSAIKAYGNAIVPQVAFEIFKAIEAIKFSPTPDPLT